MDVCTHLFAEQIKRTLKFFQAVNLGLPVVGRTWVKDSLKRGEFVDPHSYLLKDINNEIKHGFCLEKSLALAKQKKVFEGLTFLVTNNVQPSPSDMSSIIKSGGMNF